MYVCNFTLLETVVTTEVVENYILDLLEDADCCASEVTSECRGDWDGENETPWQSGRRAGAAWLKRETLEGVTPAHRSAARRALIRDHAIN